MAPCSGGERTSGIAGVGPILRSSRICASHRTGVLVMSYILAREGRPPFVLTVENAKAYFDPSTLIIKTRKHSTVGSFKIRRI